jgi:sec-independent protein translocase protein TatA
MAGLGGPEIILIVLVILLMFGGKKLPELMRGLGRGMKEFKDAKDGTSEDSDPFLCFKHSVIKLSVLILS